MIKDERLKSLHAFREKGLDKKHYRTNSKQTRGKGIFFPNRQGMLFSLNSKKDYPYCFGFETESSPLSIELPPLKKEKIDIFLELASAFASYYEVMKQFSTKWKNTKEVLSLQENLSAIKYFLLSENNKKGAKRAIA